MGKGITIILSAPSGTGKTTTCKILLERLPGLKIVVSHTTRAIRNGEKEGRDYYFISPKEFESKIENNEFLEWARIHGFYYGTTLESVTQSLKNESYTLLELDVQGVENLKRMKYEGIYILILPPSIKEMEARLKKRGTDSLERIQQRIGTGRQEIKKYKMYDYVITNHKTEDTVNSILGILNSDQQSEKLRVSQYVPTSRDIDELLKDGVG